MSVFAQLALSSHMFLFMNSTKTSPGTLGTFSCPARPELREGPAPLVDVAWRSLLDQLGTMPLSCSLSHATATVPRATTDPGAAAPLRHGTLGDRT